MNSDKIKALISVCLGVSIAVVVLVVSLLPMPAKPSNASTGLHVYLSHGGRLVYLCQSGKPIQQVINCDNGESVLLTAGLANELVLSTFRIEKGVK